MAKSTRKGSELANVAETWDQNERKRQQGLGPEREAEPDGENATSGDDLTQVIREEAAEYDRENKEDRLLSGERATVNDDSDEATSGS